MEVRRAVDEHQVEVVSDLVQEVGHAALGGPPLRGRHDVVAGEHLGAGDDRDVVEAGRPDDALGDGDQVGVVERSHALVRVDGPHALRAEEALGEARLRVVIHQ